MPAYSAGDLLLAMMTADTGTTQVWKGGNPVASVQYDDSGAFTDYTTAASNATTADVFYVPVAPTVNDAWYVGSGVPFTDLFTLFSTQGAGVWTITWEYWNGTTWSALAGVTDNTTGFKAAVTFPVSVTWTMPTDWATTAVNSITKYYVRGRVSAFTSITTRPVGSRVWVCDSNQNGWQQFDSTSNTANLGWLYKTATASEVDTTFFYTIAETVNGTIVSIRDVDAIADSGSNAQTISVVAASKTYTRSAGSFVTDGFKAGMVVTASGFTNGGNNGRKEIASVSTTVLTMTVATGLVDETGNANERMVSSPFDGTVGIAKSTTAAAKANMPTITTVKNNCLLLYGISHSAIAVPSLIEGAVTQLIGKDGSAHSDAIGWSMQGVAGTTPSTVGQSNLSAAAAQLAVLAIAPKGENTSADIVVPGYCAADSSVYVSPFTAAAFNGDSAPATTFTTPFTGTIDGLSTGAAASVAALADSGINSFHALTNITGGTTANRYDGIRQTMVARTTLAGKNLLFHIQPTTPVAIQTTDSVTLAGARGIIVGLASTASNFKMYHVSGAFNSWGVSRAAPVVINTDYAGAGLIQTTGTLNAASITEIGVAISAKTTAAAWSVGSVWALDTCTIAGGSTIEPLDMEGIIRAYADGHERKSAIRQGKSQGLFLGPVQIGNGGTNPVKLSLDATAIEFPRQYNKALKEVYYNSVDNFAGLIYYAGASDVITHKNSVVSSPSRYKWGFHTSYSTSCTPDFDGLNVIGAGTITLNKAVTVTGLTINDYSTIDATGLTFDQGAIKNVPVGNASITTTSATLIKRSSLDVSKVTAGNYWATTTTPVIFEDNTFTGGGGHAIRITTAGTYTFKGNQFTSFGADGSNGAAIYNDSGGLVTLNLSGGGAVPTVRNGASASTVINNTVTVKVTAKDSATLAVITAGVRVLLLADSGGPLPSAASVTISRVSSTATVAHTAHGLKVGGKVQILGANEQEYLGVRTITAVTANTYDYTVTGTPTTPATGTITATAVILDGTTDGSGVLQDAAFNYSSTQPVTGKARRGGTAPFYKTGTPAGSITAAGFDNTVFLVADS